MEEILKNAPSPGASGIPSSPGGVLRTAPGFENMPGFSKLPHVLRTPPGSENYHRF
jgi:hypothetical protein